MTSQSLISADKKKNNNFKFFLRTLKDAWTQGVICFSVMFFCAPVLLLMACNSYDATVFRPYKDIDGLVEAIGSCYSFYCVIAAVMAVFFAISMFSYLNSRVSVNFYHSLPFKRTRMFTTSYFAGIIMFGIGFFANYLISILIPAVTDMGFSECLPIITSICLNAFVYFIFIYSITVLVGMTTGLAAVQWLVTIGVVAILPALKLCTCVLRSFKNSMLWTDYYLSYEKFLPTSPVVILFKNEAFSTPAVLLMLALALICALFAILLYHYRLSERSGNPFVFPRFASVVKYLAMLLASMGFAIIFGYMGEGSFLWLIFGSISGSIVVWMIMNSIINKTARAMFTARRGMIVFTALVTLFNVFLVYGLDNVENAILKNERLISSVKIELDGNGELGRYEFKDDSTKRAVLELIYSENEGYGGNDAPIYYGSVSAETASIVAYSDIATEDTVIDSSTDNLTDEDVTYDELKEKYPDVESIEDGYISINGNKYYIGSYASDYLNVNLVAKTIFGYEIALDFGLSDRVCDYLQELKVLADSEEFKKQSLDKLDGIDDEYRLELRLQPNMIRDGKIMTYSRLPEFKYLNANYSVSDYDESVAGEMMSAYKKDIEQISFEDYNSPIIGTIYLRDRYYFENVSLPITLKFENTLAYLEKCGIINSTEYARDLAEAVETVYVYDRVTERLMTVTNVEAKCEILENVDTYDIMQQYSSCFNVVDHRYVILFDFECEEQYYYSEHVLDENGDRIVDKSDIREEEGTSRSEFVRGCVPEFVDEYFAN